jgi:single-strand DNA-binding protein
VLVLIKAKKEMIKLQVVGNLGKDCVQSEYNGRNVLRFSVAHSEKYKDAQGNLQTKTIWVDCSYWTDRLGIAPYLKKGTTVYVEGSPSADAYTNQQGAAAASLRLNVREIQLIGGSRQEDGGNQGTAPMNTTVANQETNSNAGAGAPVFTPPVINDGGTSDEGLPF